MKDTKELTKDINVALEINENDPRLSRYEGAIWDAFEERKITQSVGVKLLQAVKSSHLTEEEALELYYITKSADLVQQLALQTRMGRRYRDIKREAIRNQLPVDIYQQDTDSDPLSVKFLFHIEKDNINVALYTLSVPHVIALADHLAEEIMNIITAHQDGGSFTKEYLKDIFSREIGEKLKQQFIKVKNKDELILNLKKEHK